MSSLEEYINVVKMLFTNINLKKKSPSEYRNEIKKYREYRFQNKNDPNLVNITNEAVNKAISEYQASISVTPPTSDETNEYIKITKKLYTKINILGEDQMNLQSDILFYKSYRMKYANYENLKQITDYAINEAISEHSKRSNETLTSQTSNQLLVLKQAIMKNYKLKLDKKIMNNTVLDEIISESDGSVILLEQKVKPEDIQNVEEKALFDFLVIIVKQYINPIKEDIKKLALRNDVISNQDYIKKVAIKDILDGEINDYISKNSFLADKRPEIEKLGNDDSYVILEGFKRFERTRSIGIY